MTTIEPMPRAAAVRDGAEHATDAAATAAPARPVSPTRRTAEVHRRSSHGALARLRGPAA